MKQTLQSRYQALKRRIGLKSSAPVITNHKRIVIYLHQIEPIQASWVIITDHNQIQQTVIHGDLNELTSIAKQYEIDVIIPGQDVLLTHAELPKLSRERLLQALPYAVEDKLIDDINNLHFAVGKSTPQNTPVAIISKHKMQQCLQNLMNMGISPNTFIPATLALPWTEHDWYICQDETTSILRTSAYHGFTCDKSNLQTLLQLQLLELVNKPECIHIENTTSTPLNLNIDLVLIDETTITETHYLEKIAILLGANPYINLLQGAFRPKQQASQTKRIWITAGALIAAWFFVSLFSNLLSFSILHHAKAQTEHEINLIYHEQFPTATSVVAPRDRMESALKKASTEANKNDFLTLIALLSDAMERSKDIRLSNLDYQDNRMNITVQANSFDHLDGFTQALNNEGLKVKQQNAAMADSKVKANIFISKGGL